MSEIFRAGLRVDAAAKQYQRDHGGDYSNAVRQVIREANTRHERQTAQAERRYQQEHGSAPSGFRIFQDSADNVIDLQLGDGESISRLSHVVSGLPRNDDGSINIELALRIINAEFSELSLQSAGAYLGHIAQKIRGESKAYDPMTPMQAMQEAQRRFPEVASVYGGNRMSESALRVILAPLFKTPQTPPAPGERSYAAGRNYEALKTYTLDVK